MIALGSDHGGYELKQEIKRYLEEQKLEYKDFGSYDEEACDYPVYAKEVAHAVADGECEKGILTVSYTHLVSPVSFKNTFAKYLESE